MKTLRQKKTPKIVEVTRIVVRGSKATVTHTVEPMPTVIFRVGLRPRRRPSLRP